MPDYTENWKYELAKDIYAYPSANAEDKGDVNSEENIAGITYHLTQKNYIITYSQNQSPMPLEVHIENPSGDIAIAKGSCMINGYYIELNRGTTAPLSDFVDISTLPNSILHVVFKLVRDTTGNLRGDLVEVSPDGMQAVCQGVSWSILTDSQFNDLKSTDTPYLEIGQIEIVDHQINQIIIPDVVYAYIDLSKVYVGDSVFEDFIEEATSVMTKVNELDDEINNDVTGLKPKVDGLLSKDPSNSNSLLNLIYPIGSIYMSVNNISPDTIFGGTWVAIHGRFLVAEGNNGALGDFNLNISAGTSGGRKEVALTLQQMPSHNHTASQGTHSHNLVNSRGYDMLNDSRGWAGDSGSLHWGFGTTPTGTGGNLPYVNLNQQEHTEYVNLSGTKKASAGAITINSTGGGQAHENLPPYLAVYMWKRTA